MMTYVEANRTVEVHPECILLLYVFDSEQRPVPNLRIKLWAGPPPTGRPPYYEDSDIDSAGRRTDANGKFQFIVAKPAPTHPLDFFAQPTAEDGVAVSQPVHFPFPPNESCWVIVTLTPEHGLATPAGIPPSEPEMPAVPTLSPDIAIAQVQQAEPTLVEMAPPLSDNVMWEPMPPAQAPTKQKLFPHYLLFGPGTQTGTLTNLIIALDYIIRYTPLVGFSPDEAKNAEHVTIVGDSSAVSSNVEQSLVDAGCQVSRLTAVDSYALENLFKGLIASGSVYPRR